MESKRLEEWNYGMVDFAFRLPLEVLPSWRGCLGCHLRRTCSSSANWIPVAQTEAGCEIAAAVAVVAAGSVAAVVVAVAEEDAGVVAVWIAESVVVLGGD